MTDQYKYATIRAVLLAAGSAITVGLGVWSQTNDLKTIIIATGLAFLAPFTGRSVGEGTFDSARAKNGELLEGQAARNLEAAAADGFRRDIRAHRIDTEPTEAERAAGRRGQGVGAMDE